MTDIEPLPIEFQTKYITRNPIAKWAVSNFMATFEELLETVAAWGASNVLDLACGEGVTAQRVTIVHPTARLTGLDIDEPSLKIAQRINPGFAVTRGDVYNLPYETGVFDLVIATEVLEHLRWPAEVLKEIKRVSRYCILSVPREPLYRILNLLRLSYIRHLGNYPEHVQHWSKGAFIRFARSQLNVLMVRSPIPWTMLLCEARSDPIE